MDTNTSAGVIVGVDTHKHVHAAVALDGLGARLGATIIPVGPKGYRALETWARAFGPVRAFGIEGTGSFGAGLTRCLKRFVTREIYAHLCGHQRAAGQRATAA